MTIVLASNNQKKLTEMRQLMDGTGVTVKSLREMGADCEPEETGKTFAENAFIKAKAALDATGCASLSDDSGLCVDMLDGAPGVFSARYGNFTTDAERNAYLLRQMKDCAQRRARFVSALVCLIPDASAPEGYRRVETEMSCEGEILTEERGSGGFGYDPLFYLPELGRTMAELEPGEKNRVSHRGLAMRALRERLLAELAR